jgi:hypothetical protein
LDTANKEGTEVEKEREKEKEYFRRTLINFCHFTEIGGGVAGKSTDDT